MEEILALIEQIIREHKVILRRFQTLDRVANDAEAMIGFEKAKEAFMPGRFGQKQGLQKMQELLDIIDQGLQAHFNREEKTLLPAVKERGEKEFVSALSTLFLEHSNLRSRIARSKKNINELAGGRLARHLWEASAHDMRTYISHSRNLLEKHAHSEQEVFATMRDQLRTETKRE